MNGCLFKLFLVAGLILLSTTPVNADVSHAGYYFALTFVLGVLFLPVLIVALSHRRRKVLYLTALTAWAVAAFIYLWSTGGRQSEFFLISSLPYIILVVYFVKEKKLV